MGQCVMNRQPGVTLTDTEGDADVNSFRGAAHIAAFVHKKGQYKMVKFFF